MVAISMPAARQRTDLLVDAGPAAGEGADGDDSPLVLEDDLAQLGDHQPYAPVRVALQLNDLVRCIHHLLVHLHDTAEHLFTERGY